MYLSIYLFIVYLFQFFKLHIIIIIYCAVYF